MTNPIPGADSERAAFESWARDAKRESICRPVMAFNGNHMGYSYSEDAWLVWQAARAAAKVGANVAASTSSVGFTESDIAKLKQFGAEVVITQKNAVIMACRDALADRDAEIARLAAGAPAETPKENFHEKLAREIRDGTAVFEKRAFCAPAETPKPIVECPRYDIGCGRIESLWCDNCPERTKQPSPAPIAGDVEKDALAKAYGYLWHVNAASGAPAECEVMSLSPERAAYEARKALRDLLTHEQRGKGIEAARAAMLANSSSGEAAA